MKHIQEMTKKDVRDVKLVVFDVDGVLVSRGTKIKTKGNITTLETKKISEENINHIRQLRKKGFQVNINSGRGLYMLQEMFREVLDSVSLTFENGSATWMKGKVYQHVNSFSFLRDVYAPLKRVKHKNIKGFEPKEFIITIHCIDRVKAIERIISKHKDLYYVWNSEAYDIGVKKKQMKSIGLRKVMKLLKLKKKNVMVIGDNYNDRDLLSNGGVAITADKSRVKGDFYVDLSGEQLPAYVLMEKLLSF